MRYRIVKVVQSEQVVYQAQCKGTYYSRWKNIKHMWNTCEKNTEEAIDKYEQARQETLQEPIEYIPKTKK